MTTTTHPLAAFQRTALYHMTDATNLPTILEVGLLSHHAAHGRGLVQQDISMADVQDRRAMRFDTVHHRPLHDYACLYFDPRNPMLYCRRDRQDQLAILAINPDVLVRRGVVFTDGNAACRSTTFYGDLDDLDQVPWDVICTPHWNEWADGKRLKCAEVLVPDMIEPEAIVAVHFRREQAARSFHSTLTPAQQARIEVVYNSSLYF